jgi:hypothetical protein
VRPSILTLCTSLLFGVATPLAAQATALPGGTVCDMSARVIAMRLVDAQNRGIGDAAIAVRRARTGARIASAAPMGSAGDYRVLQDGALPDVRADGEPFDITFRRGRTTVRHRVWIGRDLSGCHIEVKRGTLIARM